MSDKGGMHQLLIITSYITTHCTLLLYFAERNRRRWYIKSRVKIGDLGQFPVSESRGVSWYMQRREFVGSVRQVSFTPLLSHVSGSHVISWVTVPSWPTVVAISGCLPGVKRCVLWWLSPECFARCKALLSLTEFRIHYSRWGQQLWIFHIGAVS